MTSIKALIKEVAGVSIYFSMLALAAVLILYSIIYNSQYIFGGFTTLFCAIIGASIRLLYKDIRTYEYKNNPPIWLYIGYHAIQLIIIGLWMWVTIKYLFLYNHSILKTYGDTLIYYRTHGFTGPGVIEWIGAIGTLILGVIAIFGEQIRKLLFRPKLMPVEVVRTEQKVGGSIFIYQRLIVKNVGLAGAKGVRILLTYSSTLRNFIPVPIAWTHWQTAARDIAQHEPAYIDILRKETGTDIYSFCWPFENGIPYEKLLLGFDQKHGDIRLEFFEHDQQVGDIILEFLNEEDVLKIKS